MHAFSTAWSVCISNVCMQVWVSSQFQSRIVWLRLLYYLTVKIIANCNYICDIKYNILLCMIWADGDSPIDVVGFFRSQGLFNHKSPHQSRVGDKVVKCWSQNESGDPLVVWRKITLFPLLQAEPSALDTWLVWHLHVFELRMSQEEEGGQSGYLGRPLPKGPWRQFDPTRRVHLPTRPDQM